VGSVSGAKETFMSAGVYGGIFGGMGGATGIERLRTSPPRSSSTAVSVQTVSLTSVLEEVKAPKFIDYLSLDVDSTRADSTRREGCEVGVGRVLVAGEGVQDVSLLLVRRGRIVAGHGARVCGVSGEPVRVRVSPRKKAKRKAGNAPEDVICLVPFICDRFIVVLEGNIHTCVSERFQSKRPKRDSLAWPYKHSRTKTVKSSAEYGYFGAQDEFMGNENAVAGSPSSPPNF